MKTIKSKTQIPPLIIIGTLIVIFPLFVFMTIDRINRQKAQSIKLLVEKSTALIRAFEAGAYTGMMNMQWGDAAMENLLRETAALPDIDYLFITDKNGVVLIHNEKDREGLVYGRQLSLDKVLETDAPGWRIMVDEKGNKVFEVYRKFSPAARNMEPVQSRMPSMHMQMHANAFRHADTYADTIIFVGLDMDLIEQADKSDMRHTIMMAVILALIGFSGLVLVFIVQRYTQARSSLSRIQVFSDSLVENMPVGLIATDVNNRIISVNPAAESILDIRFDLKTKEAEPDLPEEIWKILDRVREKKGLVDREIQVEGTGRPSLTLEVIASALHDREGEPLGSLLLLRDKTELNQLKTKMEENRRLAAIGRLAAGVAHEIRNPLSSLKGYATFFKEVFEKESEHYTIADVMTKEVDRLNRVVSELVELARPVAVSGKSVDMEALVQECTTLLAYEPDAGEVDIRTEFEKNLPKIHADADRLRQVLLNLCLNALQAMAGKGVLYLRLKCASNSDSIVISISDTGCGIKEEDLSHIFDPYFTTKLSGTGLGLAIVHNIIKAHKGKIDVKSRSDEGTTFTITLPIRSDA